MDVMDKRREEIVKLTNEEGSISFAKLKEHFPQVSEMTLRTDLKKLDEQKRIVRVHGGAKSVQVVIGTDDLLGRRNVRNKEAKEQIAQKALSLIKPHTTIFLDSGSTTTALAKLFPDQPNIIFTTGLSCAGELCHLEEPEVRIPGGKLNRYSMSVCGYSGISELESVNIDVAFIGVTCYSRETGFTCGVAEEAELKRMVMRRAEKNVILMDSSKIGTRSTFTFCDLKDVDIIVSDDNVTGEMKERIANAGIKLL